MHRNWSTQHKHSNIAEVETIALSTSLKNTGNGMGYLVGQGGSGRGSWCGRGTGHSCQAGQQERCHSWRSGHSTLCLRSRRLAPAPGSKLKGGTAEPSFIRQNTINHLNSICHFVARKTRAHVANEEGDATKHLKVCNAKKMCKRCKKTPKIHAISPSVLDISAGKQHNCHLSGKKFIVQHYSWMV